MQASIWLQTRTSIAVCHSGRTASVDLLDMIATSSVLDLEKLERSRLGSADWGAVEYCSLL